jgi:type II secretion system protein G
MSFRPRLAFTLIELLIVVAIIAILAAIAVPNFLEAQVRAKVARSQADLRTLATALESYRVDANRYPRAELNFALGRRLSVLTTPIAYLSSAPADPFFRDNRPNLAGFEPEYVYCSGNIYFGNVSIFDNSIYIGSIYSVSGRGPDANINFGGYCMAHPVAVESGAHLRGAYDPTNGTVSPGDLIRLSPGTLGASSF